MEPLLVFSQKPRFKLARHSVAHCTLADCLERLYPGHPGCEKTIYDHQERTAARNKKAIFTSTLLSLFFPDRSIAWRLLVLSSYRWPERLTRLLALCPPRYCRSSTPFYGCSYQRYERYARGRHSFHPLSTAAFKTFTAAHRYTCGIFLDGEPERRRYLRCVVAYKVNSCGIIAPEACPTME